MLLTAGGLYLNHAHQVQVEKDRKAAEHAYIAKIKDSKLLNTDGGRSKVLLSLGRAYCAKSANGSVTPGMKYLDSKFKSDGSGLAAGVDPATGVITDMDAFSADLTTGVTGIIGPMIIGSSASMHLCPATKKAFMKWTTTQ